LSSLKKDAIGDNFEILFIYFLYNKHCFFMQEMLVFQGALIPLKYENCYLARSVKTPSDKIKNLESSFELLQHGR
jgi:hypothetical protein